MSYSQNRCRRDLPNDESRPHVFVHLPNWKGLFLTCPPFSVVLWVPRRVAVACGPCERLAIWFVWMMSLLLLEVRSGYMNIVKSSKRLQNYQSIVHPICLQGERHSFSRLKLVTYEAAPSEPSTGLDTSSSTFAKAPMEDRVLSGPFEDGILELQTESAILHY